ncbi:hypothetical protein F0U60_11995 [Archangium minus]|uniref:Uncharacterized protein n=1 Tax=Archangium minus TaxID=83450 RepID=A0ABY9WM83_9BACT|nr:hypothetical protein F0U60_11995 [Archangium minus]
MDVTGEVGTSAINEQQVHEFLSGLFAEDLHVKLTVHKSTLKGQRNDVEDTVLLRLRELIPREVKVGYGSPVDFELAALPQKLAS